MSEKNFGRKTQFKLKKNVHVTYAKKRIRLTLFSAIDLRFPPCIVSRTVHY